MILEKHLQLKTKDQVIIKTARFIDNVIALKQYYEFINSLEEIDLVNEIKVIFKKYLKEGWTKEKLKAKLLDTIL